MIAPGWSSGRIEDACFVGDGAHASIRREVNGVPYLTARNFKEGKLDLSTVDFISEEDFAKYFRVTAKAPKTPRPDDVVFSIIGTIGAGYLVRKEDRFGISSSVAILRPEQDKIISKYLLYWIHGPVFQHALYGIKGGVAQGYVSLEMIRSLPLSYPNPGTQQKIAGILSAYDDLIENNTRRIKLLEQIAQALYCEWFVRPCQSGKLPKRWEKKKLAELVEVQKGKKPENVTEMWENGFVLQLLLDAIEGGVQQFASPKGMVLVGADDVVMVMDGARSGIVFNGLTGAIGSTLARFRPLDKAAFSPFLLMLMFQDRQAEIQAKNVGAAIPHANKEYLRLMEAPVPPRELNGKFHAHCDRLYALGRNLARKNANLRRTRDLLLPKLISGEVDISALDIETGEKAA